MDLFKEKLIELVFNVLAWSIIVSVFLLVGGGAVLFTAHFPYVVTGFILLIIVLRIGIYVYSFVERLFIEPSKTHKKAKDEHSTKFKVD